MADDPGCQHRATRASNHRPPPHDGRATRASGQPQAPTAGGCRGGRRHSARALGTGARSRYVPPCLAPRRRRSGLACPRCCASARKRWAEVAALEPQQRAVRHGVIVADYTALRAASRTAVQDFQARIDRPRHGDRSEAGERGLGQAQISSSRGPYFFD